MNSVIVLKIKKKAAPLSALNREFFQRFYEQYKEFLLYIACRYTHDRAQQEDLIQDSLVRLMKNTEILGQLTRPQAAKYIGLTVKTAWLDMEQRKCRENLVLLDEAALEAMLRRRETTFARDAVAMLRADLTAKDWAVLEGKYIMGCSDQELSALFGVTPDSMRSLISRARKRARKILSVMDKEGDV